MKLIFIDEVEQQQKREGFFGVASLVVDSASYRILKRGVDDALDDAGWNRREEFKGRYIFSRSKGDPNVAIERRIEIVRKIVGTTTAKKNARGSFCFAYKLAGKTPDNYLNLVAQVTGRCARPRDQKRDRPLVTMYLDQLDLVKPKDVERVVIPELARRDLTLVENADRNVFQQ